MVSVAQPARRAAVKVRRSIEDAQVVGILGELESSDADLLVPNVVHVQFKNNRAQNSALGDSMWYRFLIAVGGSEAPVDFEIAQAFVYKFDNSIRDVGCFKLLYQTFVIYGIKGFREIRRYHGHVLHRLQRVRYEFANAKDLRACFSAPDKAMLECWLQSVGRMS
ncbi:hypothetical protein EVAR_31252_1 [Eumeta japonica]|uniref:Uncharacterized protein n=1 Tax=Eumeta variegata TaxID=151549 RepID=A0A4C1W2K2_EUMVA|nr:hypothetical protein EVAR_31252_1 [Eumeta japonica]